MTKPHDIRKLLASLFQKNDGFALAQSALEETRFVDDVLSRVHCFIFVNVLACKDEQSKPAAF